MKNLWIIIILIMIFIKQKNFLIYLNLEKTWKINNYFI